MSFLKSFDISASGMAAQRLRLDVASANIANIETTRTENGGPYRRKMVTLESINGQSFRDSLNGAASKTASPGGVRATEIVDDLTDLKPVYDPEHPDADENGYVQLPNIDLIEEVSDGMAASRAYEANITAFNALKLMAQKALDIGK